MPAARITTHDVLLTALAYAGTPAARRAVWDRTDADVVRAASAALLSDARHGAYGHAHRAELRGWATSARAAVKRLPADDAPAADAPAADVIVDAPDDDDWLTVAVAVGATAAPAARPVVMLDELDTALTAPVAAPAPVWTPGRPEATAGALLALGAVFLILAVVFGWGVTAGAPAPSVSAVAADRDASRDEDSPRWDCYADGNRLCAAFHGPTR